MAGVPGLGDVPRLQGVRLAEGTDVSTEWVRIRVPRPAATVKRESVASAEHPEVVVEGVVLLHDDHDVIDLRQRVGARGQTWIGQRSGVAPLGARRQMR